MPPVLTRKWSRSGLNFEACGSSRDGLPEAGDFTRDLFPSCPRKFSPSPACIFPRFSRRAQRADPGDAPTGD